MTIIIGFLTALLVLDCLFLMLLILVQLPKKEAGLGQAFGADATAALFGAGSGNVLTKLTKYATVFFLAVTMVLAVLNSHQSRAQKSRLAEQMKAATEETQASTPATAATPATPATPVTEATVPTTPPASTTVTSLLLNTTVTNAPAAQSSNAPAPAPQNTPQK